jgi:hypothetical protein
LAAAATPWIVAVADRGVERQAGRQTDGRACAAVATAAALAEAGLRAREPLTIGRRLW